VEMPQGNGSRHEGTREEQGRSKGDITGSLPSSSQAPPKQMAGSAQIPGGLVPRRGDCIGGADPIAIGIMKMVDALGWLTQKQYGRRGMSDIGQPKYGQAIATLKPLLYPS